MSRERGSESWDIVVEPLVTSYCRTKRVQCVGVMLIGSSRKELSRLGPSGASMKRRWNRGMTLSLLGRLTTSKNVVDRTWRVSENGEC